MGVAGTTREESLDNGVPTVMNAKTRDVLHATIPHLVDDTQHIALERI
jgi:hypothetical protein